MTGKLKVGSRVCQCGGCGCYFSTPRVFDRHRVGDGEHRHCLTVAEMLAAGLVLGDEGLWTGRPPTEAELARLEGLKLAHGMARKHAEPPSRV